MDELISHELPLEEYGTGLDLIVGKRPKRSSFIRKDGGDPHGHLSPGADLC